ncbi:unnamed protein product [Ilex paraguariensis]|uniref:Uncharacterized protein n=1 Tax=Ilex paraguariensis TaxID=185542 RepID=A0ABC8RSV8_9AQUA
MKNTQITISSDQRSRVPTSDPECSLASSSNSSLVQRRSIEQQKERHWQAVSFGFESALLGCKKKNFLLCDEDIEGRKSSKAKELGASCWPFVFNQETRTSH